MPKKSLSLCALIVSVLGVAWASGEVSWGTHVAKVTAAGALQTDASDTVQPVSGIFWPAIQPISGSVGVLNLPAVYPVTGTFWQAVQPISGSITVLNLPAPAATATVSRVTVGTSAVTLLVSNPSRRRAIIFNETGTLRVKLGPNASLADYTYEVLASAGNNTQTIDNYSGIITGIKVSGITAVQVTEL